VPVAQSTDAGRRVFTLEQGDDFALKNYRRTRGTGAKLLQRKPVGRPGAHELSAGTPMRCGRVTERRETYIGLAAA